MKSPNLILGVGVAALGALVGWFTGQSGFSSDVLAAVLPAILAVVGSGTAFWALYSDNDRNRLLSGVLLVVFAASIYLGSVVGNSLKLEQVSVERQLRELPAREQLRAARLSARAAYLKKCADKEAAVNRYRVEVHKLKALPSAAICP